jgi:geranylgeranyl reductase family protein
VLRPVDRSVETLVVGAGPAGTAAATVLAGAGREVLVVDKATFPRDKCCGDGLTTLALRELERIGFDPGTVSRWQDVDSAWLRSPAGRLIEVPLPDRGLFAAVAPRIDLDAALVDLARSGGAEILDGHGVTGVHRGAGHVDVDIDGVGRVRARTVIAADGMWSTVRKATGLGIDGYRGEWHAFRQYFSGVTGAAATELIVWFEADLLPGYAWSFPLPGGRANVGFGVLRTEGRRTRDMAEIWRDLLTREHVVSALGTGATPEGRHTAWPIPARVDAIELASPGVLFVGDAAAATDVLTGEGIGQALLSGRLAAEAVLAGGGPRAIADRYREEVRSELVADHAMSRRLGRVLAHRRGAEAALRVVAASGEWGRRNFARWMFEDEPRAIALTPSRWHRGMFARAGTFTSAAGADDRALTIGR